jgi:DNA mismatch endonuclease, patch repair protein
MADVHSKEIRSFNMSRIKGKDTGPEMIVRRFLHSNGFRYRLHSRRLPGKPDIVLKKYRVIVDVRGCFWHGHTNCKFGDQVKSESSGIMERIRTAIQRDSMNVQKWKKLGWRVIIIWDSCELENRKKKSARREKILMNLLQKIRRLGDTNN